MLLPATAAAATAARTATTAAAALTLLRFVDAQRTTAHVLAVQGLDGTLCVGARHFDEAEAARTAGFTIVDQRDLLHRTVRFEQRANIMFSCGKRQVANIDFRHTDKLSLKKPRARSARTRTSQTLRGLVTNGLHPRRTVILTACRSWSQA